MSHYTGEEVINDGETEPISWHSETARGFPAYACRHCYLQDGLEDRAEWRITRRGDVATSWACNIHLASECHHMQRDFDRTELVVTWAP